MIDSGGPVIATVIQRRVQSDAIKCAGLEEQRTNAIHRIPYFSAPNLAFRLRLWNCAHDHAPFFKLLAY